MSIAEPSPAPASPDLWRRPPARPAGQEGLPPQDADLAIGMYRSKPTQAEAVQLTAGNLAAVAAWVRGANVPCSEYPGHLLIPTPHGDLRARPGTWIIQERGMFRCCSGARFADSYEPAAGAAAGGRAAVAAAGPRPGVESHTHRFQVALGDLICDCGIRVTA